MEEKENKEAILGSKVEAEENEYEGFAFNEDVIGSVLEGTADPSLVLKLFYNRKSYNVSYQYVNAPENASALPETKSYKYMQPVKVADAASAEGYTFSGWNKENFNMPSGDVVISGSFDINSYKVTYRYENAPANAPALPAEAFYNYKENVEIAAAPQLKGYTFSGWDKENFTMPASDVVISGSFKANSHTVRYELEGDVPANAPALPIAREYSYGEAVTIADDLKLEGYTFSGWDKENFAMIDEDVVIRGSFQINSYKVNYEYENAPANAPALPAEAFYNYKENVEIAAAPQLKGYTFSGWNKENFTMPASDVTIKGSWTVNSHMVSYEVEGEFPADALVLPESREYKYGEAVTIADDLKLEGYTFSGWDKEDFTMDDEDVVIKGSFEINNYKVNYEYENAPENAPALPETKEVKFNSKVEIAAAPTIEGYTFSGWDKENFTMPASDVTIKGSWIVNSHMVSYEVEGEFPADALVLPESREYKYGEAVTIADDLKLEGYTFSGWDKEDFTMDDEDVVIKGSFEINNYKVNYEYENAPENAPALPETKEVKFNSKVEIAAAPTIEGYTFFGWDKEDFTMPASDVTIKGSFKVNSYTVSYEYENAPENAPELPAAAAYDYRQNVQIEAAPTMEGYTFSGWNKENFTMPASDVTIKGSWTVNSHMVSYEVEGEFPADALVLLESREYKYGEAVTIADDLKLEGYTFSGWDKEDFAMIDEDVIIKGSFEINKYNITWKNYDGSTLELDEAVEFGTMPSYDGNTPIRKADASFTYTFKGWTPVIEKVTGDKEYMAEYEAQAIIIPADDTPVKTEPANPVTPSTTNDPRLPEEPEIEIAEAPTPLAEAVNEDIAVTEIEDAMVPQAEMKSWALYNLIAAIISVITALAMVLSFFRKKEENEEEENADFNEAQIEMIENEEEEEKENDKRKKSKFLGLIPAILSVIIFIFTEDMRNPMVLKDRYTLLMVIIALATILLAFLSRNKKEEKEEEEREELEFVNAQLSE